jgi:hypothetical protein
LAQQADAAVPTLDPIERWNRVCARPFPVRGMSVARHLALGHGTRAH